MAWAIEFWVREVDAVSVQINHESWDANGDGTAWRSQEGTKQKPLPDKWKNMDKIHVYAAAIPKGKNAEIRVLWDGSNRKTFTFDDDEDHDVSRP